jgi:hypothetical protein
MPKKGNQELLLAIGMDISEIRSDYMLPCELCVVTYTGHIHCCTSFHLSQTHRNISFVSHQSYSHHSYVQINCTCNDDVTLC